MTVKVGGKDAINAWLADAGYRMRYLNRGWEYRRKLLAKLDPRFATVSAEEVTGLQYALQTAAPDAPAGVFEHYRRLFTGPRAAWLDIVRNPDNRRLYRANQRTLMVEDRDVWLGDITAREIARMIEAIERCTLTSPASCETMKLFLRRQLAGASRLPHLVDVPVAHKTGDSGNIANDVGIIYSGSGPIVIAALVTGITGQFGEAEDRIARLARTVVDHFDGGGQTTPAAPPPARRVIQPRGYKPTPSPLTPGIMVGDTVYLSGSTGGDPATGQLVKGGFEAEMRQIMANMQAVLQEAGMTLADVVSVTGYLVDMADFARYNEIYVEYFKTTPLPTRSTVAVKELARGARIEMTMTAVRSK
jgi:2-iminobutanoate/2-iminopropanoate deaminase